MLWVQKTNNLVKRLGEVGGGDGAEAAAVGGRRSALCPKGIATSLRSVVSAVLTQRVMVELALIMTFPSVAAIDQRDA